MRRASQVVSSLLLMAVPLVAQDKRLWVLRAAGEMVEYDPSTFAAKQTVKVPAEAVQAPRSVSVNRMGQILFAPAVSLPLADSDIEAPHKVWFWNGRAAVTFDLGVKRENAATGSNLAVTELAPEVHLAADGGHLVWFANQERRLVREGVDLSVTTTWEAWQTDLNAVGREDLATSKLPECRCPTGACEESCPYGVVWVPDSELGTFCLMTQFVAGKDQPAYKASARYQLDRGKWIVSPLPEPLQRVLDAAPTGDVIVEAIPDTACCGWSNQSNDQTLVRASGKTRVIFDERTTYKNPDYDVSFYTSNARLSLDLGMVAITVTATAQPSQPIQLAEEGQANPEESRQIRKALAELPAVEVKTLDESPRRVAFLPHTTLVGWISEKELLVVEDHILVAYNLATGARRKSTLRVDDAAGVFLR